MSQKPIVLVTGATGAQGGAVVSELLKGDKLTIRAITRNPSSPKARALTSKGVQVVKADMSDAASLRSAFSGVDRAYLVTDMTGPKGTKGETESGKIFIAAAHEASVQHFVFSSVCNAETHTGVPHFESKLPMEQVLKASGSPSWTILRPVTYMDNFPTEPGLARMAALGTFATLLRGKSIKLVAVQDIGWFAARALEDPEQWRGKEISLAGDDVTVQQMKDAYAKVPGPRPWAAWIPSVALRWMLSTDYWLMFKFFREEGFNADVQAGRAMYPEMLTFEQYIRSKSHSKSS